MNRHDTRRRLRQLPPAPLELADKSRDPNAVTTLPGNASPQDLAPVALTASRAIVMERGEGRSSVRWWNDGPGRVFLGGSAVDASSGIPIEAGSGFVEVDAPNGEWWAISDSTATLRRIVMK